jgi:hypothetical protein
MTLNGQDLTQTPRVKKKLQGIPEHPVLKYYGLSHDNFASQCFCQRVHDIYREDVIDVVGTSHNLKYHDNLTEPDMEYFVA